MSTTYIIFTSTILILDILLFCHCRRKRNFWPLFLGGILVLYGIAVGWGFIPKISTLADSWISLLSFFSLFALSVVFSCFLLEEKKLFVIDTCLEGYALQHIASCLVALILSHWLPLGRSAPGQLNWFLLVLLVYPPIYALGIFYILSMRKRYGQNDDIRVTLVAIPLLIACFMLRRLDALFALPHQNELTLFLYPLLICILTLLLQGGLLLGNQKEKEAEMTRQLLEKEKQKYQSWMDSVNLLNMKYHDLKYMIRDYRNHQNDQKLEEMEKALVVYDNIARTGNEALDLLFYEKNNECLEKGIIFTYLVDGKQFSFLETEDLLVLFGNIIDNAIEGVMHFPEKEKRVISLKAVSRNGMIFLTEANYAREDIVLIDGVPQTDKPDKNLHGFGTRSIQYLAEHYGGNARFSVENGMFHLTILFPSREKKNQENKAEKVAE